MRENSITKFIVFEPKNNTIKKTGLIIVLFFLLEIHLAGQIGLTQKYFAISIERKRHNTLHKVETFYWIIGNTVGSQMAPIIYNGINNYNILTCCSGDSSYVYTFLEGANYNLNPEDEIYYKNFFNIVSKKKKQIQVINKKWKNGGKESIKVFITPIRGLFCICPIFTEEMNRYDLPMYLAIPKGRVEFDAEFSQSSDFNKIIPNDFALFKIYHAE